MTIATSSYNETLGKLEIPTFQEIFDSYVAGAKLLFGNDTNFETNSLDGQKGLILSQAFLDKDEALQSVWLSFFVQNATGIALDYLAARKGLVRKKGSFSSVNIEVTVNNNITLAGLDGDLNNLNGTGYTVKDSVGNRWILVATTNLTIGTTTPLLFRSATLGANTALANTLTIPETIVVGVTNVNNPAVQNIIGKSAETDIPLRARVLSSYANTSGNQFDAIYSKLLNLTGVTDLNLDQNNKDVPKANGTGIFSIWAIVEGGLDTDIAHVIYNNIHGGGTRGAVTVQMPTINGVTEIPISFDRPIDAPITARINIQTLIAGTIFDIPALQFYISTNLKLSVGKAVSSEDLTLIAVEAIASINGSNSGAVTNARVNDGGGFTRYLQPTTLQHKFSLQPADINIVIAI